MPRRPMFPDLDPTLVTPGAKFLKNSANYRGKGVLDVVDRLEDVTDSTGTHVKVYYHNDLTGRRASMMMTEFCQGVEHLPYVEPTPEPAVVPVPDAEGTPFDLESEVRALRAQQTEILARLAQVLKALPPQLSLIGQ